MIKFAVVLTPPLAFCEVQLDGIKWLIARVNSFGIIANYAIVLGFFIAGVKVCLLDLIMEVLTAP
ncbi:hypothetical protein [Shewanella glacialipiscicola]|uniref:hypothetical protein n=1 Tax=Shewanella glacialipiscicola TaxID=614069 RepID=UPI003D792585